jgi:NAD(P)-dependent dehydrogenase (short-subunit alcohol dehydrogenase family)
MGQVRGKIAPVTGAASGIGAACAKLLACEGALVVATNIDDEGSRRQLMETIQAGGEATYFITM